MKKILAAALSATCIFSAASVPLLKSPNVYAGFSMVDDAQTAVEKNKALFLKAFKEAEISSDFTQDDLENMLFESCEYSADEQTGTGFMVEKFKLIPPSATKSGSISAVVFIYQDDAEDAFEISKDIPALSGGDSSSGDVKISTGDDDSDTDNGGYTDAELSAIKKKISAAKHAISDAVWNFDVSNDTTANDVLKMAKAAVADDSDIEVTLEDYNFKLIKSTSTVNGSLSATVTVTCGGIEDTVPIGKTVPLIVTETSSKIDEDRSLVSDALYSIAINNRTTKESILTAAQKAVKNGSAVAWKNDYFSKKNATFRDDGSIFGYLSITLGDESRELLIQEKIPMLVRNYPKDEISVNKTEWDIFNAMNVERAKEGSYPLSMVAALQDACNIREPELVESFSHTRPNGNMCFTAISDFAYSYAGENIYREYCPNVERKTMVYIDSEKAMTSWMNSPGHRANILNTQFNYAGVGAYDAIGIGTSLQLFATVAKPITEITSSTGSFSFYDEDAMQKEYLILKTSDGLVSYMPLDPAYMTKNGNQYSFTPVNGNEVVITISNNNVDNSNNNAANSDDNSFTVDPASQGGAALPFTDVKPGDYFCNAVSWALVKNITRGTSDTTFSPDATCTRAQILTFLWRAVGSPTPNISNPFADTSSSDYYYGAAIWAYEKGMVSGNLFKGDTPCTRSSTVMYLWKNAGMPRVDTSSDFSDISPLDEYSDAVSWAVENNVTLGTSETTFSPDDICSRGQIVTFLNRAISE